jgi:hypothetical protein
MVGGKLAVMTAVVVMFLCLAVVRGQEAMPSHAHAASDEHSADDGHGHEDPMADENMSHTHRENYISWLIVSLGWKYTLLLPLSALLSFGLVVTLIIFGKGRTTGAAMVFIVAIPALIGVFGTVEGAISVAMVMRSAGGNGPGLRTSDMGDAVSSCLMTTFVGMFLMVPSYLLATAGLFIKSLKGDSSNSPGPGKFPPGT